MATIAELFNDDGTEKVDTVRTEDLVQAPPSVDLSQLGVAPFGFLTGPAGTGKTTLVREYVGQHPEATLAATTGIAAVNLDAVTLNSLMGYYDTKSLMSAFMSGWLPTRLRQLRKGGMRCLIVDEVSMLDADALTTLVSALQIVNQTSHYDLEKEEVVLEAHDDGIIKLWLVGDFAQLPPVEAPFAFTSPEWHRFAEATITLTEIRRQGDTKFIQALQAIRRGKATEALETLQPCFAPVIDAHFPGTTIVAQNAEVDRINLLRLNSCPGKDVTWKTVRSGEQQKDWLRLIPEVFTAKEGALVMVLANKSYGWDEEQQALGYAYVNGDLATVVEAEEHGIRVKLHRTQEEVLVTSLTSEWKEPTGKKNPAYTVRGAVTRMPLRLAWATTVHKSQGLTLDQVQVAIHSWMFGKPSMLYVALSRCRSLEGLRIVGNGPQLVRKCKTDPILGRFL